MLKTRQDWLRVPLIPLEKGKPARPLSVLYRQLPAQTVVAAHSHGWGQLVYSAQGVLDVTTPAGRYLLPPDRAVWVPAGVPHEVASHQGAEIASIYVMPEAGGVLPAESRVMEVSPLLRALILEALRQPADYDWRGPAGRMFRTLRDQIAVAAPAPLFLPLPEDPRLLKVCYLLQAEPEKQWTIAQWGEYVGASDRTLQRLFRKETRMSFQQWREQLRLQIAMTKLVAGSESVTRIAAGLGYESASAFIALFQKHLGMSPGEYARSCRAGRQQAF